MGSGNEKKHEILDEFRSVVLSRGGVVDALLPPAVFLGTQLIATTQIAMVATLLTGGALIVFRGLRREPVTFALLGLAGSLLAFLAATWLQRAEFFYLPDVLISTTLGVVCLVSAALRQPLVAVTSRLARRWPRAWYQHPLVVPAYTEVTLVWAGYFLLQAALQGLLFQRQDVTLLAVSSLVGGWPATVVLLISSYVYGTWRLARLAGPSLDEFRADAPPPWSGQRRGF